jgi:hypothetical protein
MTHGREKSDSAIVAGKPTNKVEQSAFHHLTIDLLEDAFDELKEDAAAGVDGLTWKEFNANLVRNLEVLHARLRRGA